MKEIIGKRPAFKTGSQLVRDIDPSDIDIVVLMEDWAVIETIRQMEEWDSWDTSLDKDPRFVSLRRGKVNYILTPEVEMFFRFKAYSGALEYLQIKDKDARVDLSIACLYAESALAVGDVG